jgi:hypothetical protein
VLTDNIRLIEPATGIIHRNLFVTEHLHKCKIAYYTDNHDTSTTTRHMVRTQDIERPSLIVINVKKHR